MKKWVSLAIGLVAVIGAFVIHGLVTKGGGAEQQGPGRRPPLVRVEQSRLGAIEEILETTAEIVATNTVTIRATMEGPISFLPWREGDVVSRAGEKLVEIDRSVHRQEALAAEAALGVAEATLADLKAGARDEEVSQAADRVRELEASAAYAEADWERVESLVSAGAVPGEEAERARLEHVRQQTLLSSARHSLAMLQKGPTETQIGVQDARVREARARLSLARARLSECTISSPFSGVVSRVFARPGDLASPREPLMELFDNDSIVVRFAVPEAQASGVTVGGRARVRLDSMPGRTLDARVVRIYPEIDRRTRTRTTEAVVSDDIVLVPGQFARVSLPVRSVDDAVVITDSAVSTTAAGDEIVFILEEGKASRRVVTTGIEQERNIQIIEGVRPGEAVIVAGHESLRDGAEVRSGGGRPEGRESEAPAPDAAAASTKSGGSGEVAGTPSNEAGSAEAR